MHKPTHTSSHHSPNPMDELKMISKEAKLPYTVREKVLREARAIDAKVSAETDASRHVPQHGLSMQADSPPQHKLTMTRRRFFYVGGIAAAAGAVFVGLGIFGGSSGGNFFTLKAFAQETPDESGAVVPLPTETLSALGSFSGGDHSVWSVTHDIDLSCSTRNVASLTYSLEGDYASLPNDNTYTDTHIYFDSLVKDQAEDGPAGESGLDFTVWDFQQNDEKKLTRSIRASFVDDGTIQALSDRLFQVTDTSSDEELWQYEKDHNRLQVALEKRFSETLAKTAFVATVTFADGSTQTKSYVITPVDNFEQLYTEWLDSSIRANVTLAKNPNNQEAKAQLEGLLESAPHLYAIAEVK